MCTTAKDILNGNVSQIHHHCIGVCFLWYCISISSSAGPVEILQRVLAGNQQYSVINGGFPYLVESLSSKAYAHRHHQLYHQAIWLWYLSQSFLVCLSCWCLSVFCWKLWHFLHGVSFCICFWAFSITSWSLRLLFSPVYSEIVFFSSYFYRLIFFNFSLQSIQDSLLSFHIPSKGSCSRWSHNSREH